MDFKFNSKSKHQPKPESQPHSGPQPQLPPSISPSPAAAKPKRQFSPSTLAKIKKVVILFCLMNILLNLAFAIFSKYLRDAEVDVMKLKPTDLEHYKKLWLITLIVGSLTTVVIHLFGLFAAAKENFILVSIYLVLNIATIANAVYRSISCAEVFVELFFMNVIWSLLSTGFAATIWNLIRLQRKEMKFESLQETNG